MKIICSFSFLIGLCLEKTALITISRRQVLNHQKPEKQTQKSGRKNRDLRKAKIFQTLI
tara:strand:+ start:228 stop:404 length:177 start_codon:yes stop_codon:yes gene_type:complete